MAQSEVSKALEILLTTVPGQHGRLHVADVLETLARNQLCTRVRSLDSWNKIMDERGYDAHTRHRYEDGMLFGYGQNDTYFYLHAYESHNVYVIGQK
jgi:hypothetical protein